MKYIIDYIIVFTDWLITAIKDILLLLWNVILIVVEAGKFLISVVTSLPALVTVPAVALVVACVLYKVLGREGGRSKLMEDLASLFGQGFSILWNAKLLGMPIMFWFVLVAIFGIIGSFLKGKKE